MPALHRQTMARARRSRPFVPVASPRGLLMEGMAHVTVSPTPTLAEAATRYAAAGWPVFPLHDGATGHCSCSAGAACRQSAKHPRTKHGFHDATTDLRRVAA